MKMNKIEQEVSLQSTICIYPQSDALRAESKVYITFTVRTCLETQGQEHPGSAPALGLQRVWQFSLVRRSGGIFLHVRIVQKSFILSFVVFLPQSHSSEYT